MNTEEKKIKIELVKGPLGKKEARIHGLEPDPWLMSENELKARATEGAEFMRTYQEDAERHLQLDDARFDRWGKTSKWNCDIAEAVMSDPQLMKALGLITAK